jgi:predicted metalloprotease
MGDTPDTAGDDPHGTDEQRVAAFERGLEADGDMWECVGLGLVPGSLI